MKFCDLSQLRIWAALTGLVLAVAYLVMSWLMPVPLESVAMLATGSAGFELFFFIQDVAQRRSRLNG